MGVEQGSSIHQRLQKVDRNLESVDIISTAIINRLQNPQPNPLHPHLDLITPDTLVPHHRYITILYMLQNNAKPKLEEKRQMIREEIYSDISEMLGKLPIIPQGLGESIIQRIHSMPSLDPKPSQDDTPPIIVAGEDVPHVLVAHENPDQLNNRKVRKKGKETLPEKLATYLKGSTPLTRAQLQEIFYPGEASKANSKFVLIYRRAEELLNPAERASNGMGKLILKRNRRRTTIGGESDVGETDDHTRFAPGGADTIALVFTPTLVSERIEIPLLPISQVLIEEDTHHAPSESANGTAISRYISGSSGSTDTTDIYVAPHKPDDIKYGSYADKQSPNYAQKEAKEAKRDQVQIDFTRLILSHFAATGNILHLPKNPLRNLSLTEDQIQALIGDGISKADLRPLLVRRSVEMIVEIWRRKKQDCTSEKDVNLVDYCQTIKSRHGLSVAQVEQQLYEHFGIDEPQPTLH